MISGQRVVTKMIIWTRTLCHGALLPLSFIMTPNG